MDRLQSMEVFVQVVDCGSFTRAAASMSMSTAMVSTHVSQMENRLGVRLLNRTTRRMELTHDGEAYYSHCRRILSEIGETESLLASSHAAPKGRLRVDIPMTICDSLIMPVLPAFRARYPDICLEISVSNHAFDITEAGYDVAIRHGEGEGANLIGRPMGSSRRMIAASPGYLARYGEPKTPEDLKQHHLINVLDVHTGRLVGWVFNRDGQLFRHELPGVIAFNHGGPRVEAAIRDMGVVQALSFQLTHPLRKGLLKRLLRDWEGEGGSLSIFYQKNRHLSAKLRAFVDFMLERYPPDKELEPPAELSVPSAKHGSSRA